MSNLRNNASLLTRDLWSKGKFLIFGFRTMRSFSELCNDFFCVFQNIWFWVFATHLTVHSGGVSRGRVCGCGVCWVFTLFSNYGGDQNVMALTILLLVEVAIGEPFCIQHRINIWYFWSLFPSHLLLPEYVWL